MSLLSCPFCGGSAYVEREGTGRQSHIIKCEDCSCSLESGETGDMRGRDWNTRQAPPVQWYRASERLPTAEDADEIGQIWIHRQGNILLRHWTNPDSYSPHEMQITSWARTHHTKPQPPTV